MKKALALLLALVMVIALCACGGSTPPAATQPPAADNNAPAAPEAPAAPADDSVHTLKFSSTAAEGNPLYDLLHKPMMDAITEASGGRIQFEVFPNGTLAGFGKIIDACVSGVCDIGFDVPSNYAGRYLYEQLIATPGISLGEDRDANLAKYGKTFAEPDYEASGVLCLGEGVVLPLYIMSSGEITGPDSLKGKVFATNATFAPLVEAFGASTQNIAPPDQYEAIKTNVISGFINGAGPLQAFKLYEVMDYAYLIPFINNLSTLYLSKAAYEKLPADLQQVIDDFAYSETFYSVINTYVEEMMESVNKAIAEGNPSFTFTDMPADLSEQMRASCSELIEAKYAELEKAGLDADGAREMIESFSK